MAFEGSTDDRLAIRELNDSYADAVFRRDEVAWASHWHEACSWNLAGTEVNGRQDVVAMWRQAMSQFSFVAFCASPGEIRATSNRATARVYTSEVLIAADGKRRHVLGRYDDELVKEQGRWLFARRSYQILHDS